MTQAELAAHLDMSERNLREVLQAVGLDHKTASIDEIRIAYIRRLREQAAGRGAVYGGGLDLVQERAALAREQRMGIAIKNAVARKEFAPVTLLGEVLATASQAVGERLEQLPGMLKRACPDLPEAARDQVMSTIASARNEWVKHTIQLVSQRLVQIEAESDDEAGIEQLR